MARNQKAKVIIVHQPFGATVLFVNKGVTTIIAQNTREWCDGFARGVVQSRKDAMWGGQIALPAGNAALMYDQSVRESQGD